ncbi:glycosyl transferase group 1 [Gemmatirosa kalamazoonensis]|uniref:Glycosyl transferase group 1 n=1 Tax=Gemmatirosa kalamazoonensis TaxID=861299 RepID=W0RIP0_9BACT|nr:glycosyltransferase family 4 protein [Gemmatirosa kalamazoonensis]AHG90656.1 glycosyl transferase group 1 [Gemmatirosa kalamazoonensis]
MKILLVNWQDRENPQAGGAEIHLHEIFGRLARGGHDVTLLCGGWPGCAPRAEIDGIDVHRVGTRHTFPFLARGYWRRAFARAPFDVLVEDINKVPLLTPRWGARRVVALVPHLFGGTVFQEAPLPLAAAVWLAERPLPLVYRNTAFHAISESTADDLVRRGIRRELIRVIYPGIDAGHYTPDPAVRSPAPLFAYLGRLKKYKGVDLVIRAFAQVRHPDARLAIAGTGDFRAELERLAASLALSDRVQFLGFISEAEKVDLLRRAWSLAFASPKEGWGITNLEAAACGTPVVASDSPGLRESVRDGETGFLVPHGDVAAMGARLQRLADSPDLVRALGASGRRFAETFTWERAAAETAAHLAAVAGD